MTKQKSTSCDICGEQKESIAVGSTNGKQTQHGNWEKVFKIEENQKLVVVKS